MHARPRVRDAIIAKKMRRFVMLCGCRGIDPSYPRSRARKNFWRLIKRYPGLAAKLGLNEASVY
jgi:hypothetical protein